VADRASVRKSFAHEGMHKKTGAMKRPFFKPPQATNYVSFGPDASGMSGVSGDCTPKQPRYVA
jgi:hypothetical protein